MNLLDGSRRILVIGSGGSGKTTLTTAIARATGLPAVHLDSLFWREGWKRAPTAEWLGSVRAAIDRPAWVMDGNYSSTMDLRMPAADTVIYLDLPPATCLWRVFRRRLEFRGRNRPSMPPGCNEMLTPSFLWWIATYRLRRRSALLARLESMRPRKRIVVLSSAEQVDALLEGLGRQG